MTARKPRPVGRQSAIVTLRLPHTLLEALDAAKGVRSELVRRAVEAYLVGGVEKWERMYREERTRRLLVERALARAREALDV